MKKFLLIIIALFFINPFLFADDPSQSGSLIIKTMKADIITASYFELKNWAERLHLDTTGTKEDLVRRLFLYYKIDYSEKAVKEPSIVITSAKKLESIHIEEVNEDYIVLSGGIRIDIQDKEKKTVQTLTADKVVFNQKQKTVSAEGHIVYVIEKDTSKEYFYGDKLTFNVDSFEGLFFKGVSEKHIEKDGEDKVFYFFGEKIYRKKGDVIILENGSIASKKVKNPYYRISADKIWILNPGEWAMSGSVLYVGRIPVFAFPFVFMPGDKLLFHPVYGVKDKNGYFINTTTYLHGQPSTENQTSSFSFLQSTDSQSKTILKREGLFLRKTTIPLEKDEDSYLKLFADYYTRKLLFVGLEGSFPNLGTVNTLHWFAGAGINRYVYSDPLYGYTPYYKGTDNTYQSSMIKPYFLDKQLPFRFGFDLNLAAKIFTIDVALKMPVYSDPDFYSDFMDRKEYFDFKEILSASDKTIPDVSASVQNSVSWNLDLNWRLNSTALQPLLSNLSVDKLTFDVSLFSNDYQLPDSNPVDPIKFYYPQNIVYPDFTGRISGEIFNTAKSKAKQEAQIPGGVLKTPWETKEKQAKQENDKDPVVPPLINDYEKLPYGYRYKGIDQSLTYSILPRVTVNSVLNSTVPVEPADVAVTPDYSMFTLQNSSSLFYNMNVSDTLLTFDSKIVLNNNYRDHFAKSDMFTGDWNSFLLQDRIYSNYSLANTTTVKTYPLLFSEGFTDSNIIYTVNSIILNHSFDKDQYFAWNKESITDHQINLSLIHNKEGFSKEFSAKFVLPPENIEIYPFVNLENSLISAKISTGIKKNEGNVWALDPLSVFGKYSFGESYVSENLIIDTDGLNRTSTTEFNIKLFKDIFALKEVFVSDVLNFRPVSSTTTFDLWRFTSSFTAERTEGYNFNTSSGWQSNLTEEFQPSKISFGLDLDYSPDSLWKNRIKFESVINSGWSMNILKPTDTVFNFDLSFNLKIEEFLDLTFKSQSINRAFYRYIPSATDKIGISQIENPLTDLLKSFNFFNTQDRIDSNFNLNLLEIDAVHHLGDWDLNLSYKGQPEIYTNADTTKEYRWTASLTIFVEWKPIPEIRKEVLYSDDELQL